MRRLIAVLLLAVSGYLCSATAFAQAKLSATLRCGKPDPVQMLPVGDRPEHALGVEQYQCIWTKPMDLGGDKSKDGQSTETIDVNGTKGHAHGTHVTTMHSGDKAFVSYQGTTTTKNGAPVESKGTWAFSGGTGKLKGIKGKGRYSCAPVADGLSCDIEGDYELAK